MTNQAMRDADENQAWIDYRHAVIDRDMYLTKACPEPKMVVHFNEQMAERRAFWIQALRMCHPKMLSRFERQEIETPRTELAYEMQLTSGMGGVVSVEFARELERDLSEIQAHCREK